MFTTFLLLAVWLSRSGPGKLSHVSDVRDRKMVKTLLLCVGTVGLRIVRSKVPGTCLAYEGQLSYTQRVKCVVD